MMMRSSRRHRLQEQTERVDEWVMLTGLYIVRRCTVCYQNAEGCLVSAHDNGR